MSDKKIDLTGLKLTDAERIEIENCPHDIVDIQKFLKHLNAKSMADKLSKHVASDGTELNLRTPANRLKNNIEHLSAQEQEKIKTKSNLANSYYTKSRNFFRSAIGAYDSNDYTSQPNHEKLMIEKKAELIEYFGRFYTIEEVHTITRKDWGTTYMTKEALSLFVKDNYDEISRLKEKHKENFEHLRLSHKSSRLEELTWMYNKLKLKYEKSGSREDHRTLIQTITEIRKEVEGDRLTIEGNIEINIQEEVNSQIRNELMRSIPLREIIIGRLAAKMGISPRNLISDMNQSYYARMNRLIVENSEEVEFEEIGFPSEQSYDFEQIEKINEEKKRKKLQDKKLEEKNAESKKIESDKNELLKQNLLDKLKKKAAEQKNNQEELRKKLS